MTSQELIYLNNQIYAYNMQSAIMNGTIAGLKEVNENTPEIEVAYIKGRLDEHFMDIEE